MQMPPLAQTFEHWPRRGPIGEWRVFTNEPGRDNSGTDPPGRRGDAGGSLMGAELRKLYFMFVLPFFLIYKIQ